MKMQEEKWLNILLDNGGSMCEFLAIYKESPSTYYSLCKYKRILKGRGLGQVSFTTLKNYYDEKNLPKLNNILNEMFLEYHTQDEIVNLLHQMELTETTIEYVYRRHLKNPTYKLLNCIKL